jgi:hypothetical protein
VPWADANRIPTSPDLVVEHLGPVAIASTVRDAKGEVRDFMYEYVNTAFAAAVGEKPETLVLVGCCANATELQQSMLNARA